MNSIFKRDMNDQELKMYNEVIDYIKNTTIELVKDLNKLIDDYTPSNEYTFRFFLDEADLSKEEKIEYLKELKEKLYRMMDCDKVRIKVATPFHPMCWCYHLFKIFPNCSFFKNYIMYGFCVPYLPKKPIMLAHYSFENRKKRIKRYICS